MRWPVQANGHREWSFGRGCVHCRWVRAVFGPRVRLDELYEGELALSLLRRERASEEKASEECSYGSQPWRRQNSW